MDVLSGTVYAIPASRIQRANGIAKLKSIPIGEVTEEEARRIGTPKEWDYANDCTDILLASTRGATL